MSIYIIGDLHLGFAENKPMDIFGWGDHISIIEKDWKEKVKEDDTVILAGDFSWATYLEDTKMDFEYINKLPGKKILLEGNHDYWWNTLSKMRTFIDENKFSNIDFLRNNGYLIEDKIIVGTRGWSFTESDNSEKMISRELIRFENSIQDGISKQKNNEEIIAVFHYPPIAKGVSSPFLEMMKKYNINRCYYAHLHGKSHQEAIQGEIEEIDFKLISSDYLGFKLVKI